MFVRSDHYLLIHPRETSHLVLFHRVHVYQSSGLVMGSSSLRAVRLGLSRSRNVRRLDLQGYFGNMSAETGEKNRVCSVHRFRESHPISLVQS